MLFLGDPPPVALVLLDHTVSLHPNLHTQAFDICCQLYDRISEESEAAEVGLGLIIWMIMINSREIHSCKKNNLNSILLLTQKVFWVHIF